MWLVLVRCVFNNSPIYLTNVCSCHTWCLIISHMLGTLPDLHIRKGVNQPQDSSWCLVLQNIIVNGVPQEWWVCIKFIIILEILMIINIFKRLSKPETLIFRGPTDKLCAHHIYTHTLRHCRYKCRPFKIVLLLALSEVENIGRKLI